MTEGRMKVLFSQYEADIEKLTKLVTEALGGISENSPGLQTMINSILLMLYVRDLEVND